MEHFAENGVLSQYNYYNISSSGRMDNGSNSSTGYSFSMCM